VDLDSLWTTLDDRLLPLFRDYRRRLPTLNVVEKADRTLLSEADVAVQDVIVESILSLFPGSGFVAEEEDSRLPRQGSPTWVIDPIDGTAEFVNPSSPEFCSVVCRLDDGTPTGAYVLAPELARGESISIHWATRVTVNGPRALPPPQRDMPVRVSVTRSKGSPARAFERELARTGCEMKLRTTSQTLDMVRTAIDLTTWTGTPGDQFDVFYRHR
jgi:3'(2'), 5'-bisphosphate nucleotidase